MSRGAIAEDTARLATGDLEAVESTDSAGAIAPGVAGSYLLSPCR